MALVSCNGATVLHGFVSFPAVGVWSASFVLEAAAAPSGAVDIESTGLSLSGFAVRGGSLYERTSIRVVGATVARTIPSKFWRGVPLRLPLADAVAALGGKLATDIDPAILSLRLDVWSRAEQAGARELDALAAAAGCSWRAKDDGSIWFGVDTWPAIEIDHRTTNVAEAARIRTIAVEDFSIRPGVMLDGMRIAHVTYRIDQEQVRCDVLGEP